MECPRGIPAVPLLSLYLIAMVYNDGCTSTASSPSPQPQAPGSIQQNEDQIQAPWRTAPSNQTSPLPWGLILSDTHEISRRPPISKAMEMLLPRPVPTHLGTCRLAELSLCGLVADKEGEYGCSYCYRLRQSLQLECAGGLWVEGCLSESGHSAQRVAGLG